MLRFTFFGSAEWTTDSVSKELYSKLEKERNEPINEQIQDRGYIAKLENENKVLKARLKDAIGIDYADSTDYISQLSKNVLNQRKELRNLNKALERERKRNKELEELYSGAQKDVSMLNLKVMELNQGIRNSTDLTWKEKYDELEAKYTADYTSLNGVINELRKRLKQKDDKIEALESGIKELSDANDDLKKKIRTLEYNDTEYLKNRCGKAESTIDTIKEALVNGDYIHRIDLRRNNE
jgi:septal ring factor EnvC (AmiA/AmiB activator)